MKVVIALSHEDFVRCCHQNNLRVENTPHLSNPNDVDKLPLSSVEPIFFGEFWKIPGLNILEDRLKSRGIKVKGKYIKK